jgi:hypothetical protein
MNSENVHTISNNSWRSVNNKPNTNDRAQIVHTGNESLSSLYDSLQEPLM